MADEKDVVRVTFKDLEQIARQNKLSYANGGKEGLPSDAQKRRAKRPERSIYRPGVSRLRKTSGSQEENDTGTSTGRLSPAESMARVSEDLSSLTLGEADFPEDGQKNNTRVTENTKHEAAGKPRRKRPDIQIYVPKGKLAEKDLDTCSQSEGVQYPGGDDEFEMSPNLNTENVTGSEEEISPPLTDHRKVNLVKAKDRQISVTVVSQERKSPIGNTSLNEDDHTSSFLKTMIFERGGFGLQHDSKQSHKDNRTFTDTDKQEQITSDKGLRALNEQRRDEEEKMRTDQNRAPAGTESPSGKNNSKRYSLAKRKGKGRRNNNHIDSDQKEDPLGNVKELATSNSELDSDVPLDEIEKLSPLVLDWGEEVERELGTEDENPLENNDSARSSKSRTKSRRRRRKNSENRARNSEGKDFDNKSESKQTTDSTSKVRDSSYRRSSLDSATWTNNTENRPARADSDAESDVTDHPSKRKRNRQRERKRTRSGPGNVNHQDSLGLRVTVDRNARQVQVNDSPQQRRPNYHSSHEHLSSDSDFAHSPKGGGILHLASPNISHPEHRQHRERDRRYNSKAAHRSHEHLPPRGDNRSQPQRERKDSARGNTGGQRTLFDPSNPSKPIVIQSASTNLQFTESGPQGPPGQFDGPHNQQFTGRGHYPSYGRSYSDAHYQPYSGGEQFYYSYPGAFQESSALRDDTYAQDPYYHSGYDPDYVIGGMSRSQCRAMADHIMRDASPLDSQLTNILSRRLHSDSQPLIKKLRHELKTAYEQVVLLDPDLANKHNVEQMLWKNVFYQVIEVHRRHLGEDKQATPNLIQLLDEADGFYEALLQKLQHTYNFRLEPFLNPAHPPPENLSRAVKLALLSSQRTMICLGDIARYREQAHGKVNYGKARSWYMKAQQIAPKNGRPYNQLAILALYTKRKLDAVYYYMRSLAASNPFLTARESLMSLFDEARKKAEATDAKKHEEREKLLSWRRKRQKEGPRVEVWVGADGRSHTGEVDETADEDLSNLAPVELNKRLSLSFLNAHGKLFTKIGMEHFELVSYQLLCEYQAVLAHRPPIVSNNRLLQLAAINMFSVDNTALKGERIEDNCRSLLQEHAVQQGLDMFAVLAARFTALLQAHLSTKDYPGRLLSDDLRELVPTIKVWSDWMMCHPTLWNPAPNLHDPDNSFKIDTWKETAEMLNILKEVDITHVKLYRDKREGCESVILEEDLALAGFVPLLSAPSQAIFVHATVEKHIAKDCLRIQKLQTFGDYLCGIEPPMLAYNVETRRYYSVAPSVDYSTDEESKSKGDNSDVEDVIIESEECEALSEEEEGETGVSELRAKKEQLQQRLHERTKRKENVEAILEKHRYRAIELRICPVFLVPDTNCFINHLAGMRKLLSSRKYTLVIPLVVINELDGLSLGGSRGGPQHSGNHHHMARVGNQAKLAVDLLETEFGRRNPHLRALTSKGNSLETIAFRSEETDNLGVNDDLILSCCLHYCKDMAKDFMPKTKDTPIVLQRDVVLLTDDRNLRLKAHTRNVPVKDVPSFLNWANIT